MRDTEILNLANAYREICEQRVGIPLKEPTDSAAKKELEKMIPKGEKVHLFKNQLQKANYELEGEMVEEVDVYDQVLEYLLGEGYSEEESNQIMVSLVNENSLSNFLKGVQQRTGIGKPGVGPGQIAKNIVKAGINDVLGTAIGAGSAPGASTPAKSPVSKVQTPPPIVKPSTKISRTAPKGANISPDPWSGGKTGNRIKDITQKPSTKPTQTRALTGSSGSNTRGLLPSSTSSARGGAIIPASKPGSITPSAKPTTSKPTSSRIERVSVREVPTSQKSLPGNNVRGLLPQGAKNILPDPWKQASDTVSGAKNLWSRVQNAVKPQSQLKPSQTSVRGLLPAAKPTPTGSQANKPTSVRSQQYQDIQRLNKMTGGGPLGSREISSNTSRAPKPAWGSEAKPSPAQAPKPVDKVAPKPTIKNKKPGKLDSLPNLGGKQGFTPSVGGPHVAAAALGLQAYNTADATRKSAPKVPTTAKEVKKGQTYYDPSTRVGSSQRFAQRLKVGPKIVGSGKVGTEAQSFDKAYGAAKAKGGMGSTFKWKGKDYKVS
jgi:hypothetical protein